jgi:hypothetical protein
LNKKRPKMHRPAAVSDLLGAVLRGTPVEKRLHEGRIWQFWEQAVGSRIASHAVPAAFRDGTLTLTVDSAPWMQQLTYLKQELIAKLNGELGEELVSEIYMKAGRVSVPAPATPWVQKRRQLSADELRWISEQSQSVADPDLRAVFERLIKRDRENR